ncbi:unnamed protein product [Microthlaspi erraticum]|uniref:Uncharacterized protein n=1 Tax=Microthlaspi erraticum TaxID=1685480 RepID=A0A6D2KPY6_9BRAS|nr:unnamed protein product [Microthlaspi erraticum]
MRNSERRWQLRTSSREFSGREIPSCSTKGEFLLNQQNPSPESLLHISNQKPLLLPLQHLEIFENYHLSGDRWPVASKAQSPVSPFFLPSFSLSSPPSLCSWRLFIWLLLWLRLWALSFVCAVAADRSADLSWSGSIERRSGSADSPQSSVWLVAPSGVLVHEFGF